VKNAARIYCANAIYLVNAGIAQLVEQLICNQQVVGSNPTAGLSHRSCQIIRNSCGRIFTCSISKLKNSSRICLTAIYFTAAPWPAYRDSDLSGSTGETFWTQSLAIVTSRSRCREIHVTPFLKRQACSVRVQLPWNAFCACAKRA
jgi:hypothetical protein